MSSWRAPQSAQDPVLRPLREARDPAARRAALENILVCHAAPVIQRVLGRYRDDGGALQPADADDVAATVTLRLLRRLEALDETGEPIGQLEDYVATQTYNCIHDVLRRRYPQRTRLKNQLRYVLTRDHRLALWNTPSGLAAGLAGQESARWPAAEIVLLPDVLPDRRRTADAVHELLSRTGPVLLDALIETFAEFWSISDEIPRNTGVAVTGDIAANVESRQYLVALWREIRELLPNQRAALLLNLRDADGSSAITLFVLLGIAALDELAAAMEMTAEQLAALWPDLPAGDRAIAERLGVTRQQVINLRKSARQRLARRMAGR